MLRSKASVLTVGLSVVILASVLGKLAINNNLPRQPIEANSNYVKMNTKETSLVARRVDAKTIETQQRSKITFQEAIQIAETAVSGKAYSVERETEDNKPVIEVDLNRKEVFVDIVSGKIVLLEDLYQKGDREDIEAATEALKLQHLATTTIQEALQAAERFAGRQAHTVEIDNDNGNLVYKVGIELQDIYVDAGNGQVLYTKTVGQVDENNNFQPSSSIQVFSTEDH